MLKQQLNDQGFVVDKFEVMVGLDDQRLRERDAKTDQGRKGRGSGKSDPKTEALSLESEDRGAQAQGLYQIDVHV